MSSQIAKLTGAWSTDVMPTQTTLTHIDPAAYTGLVATLLSASSAYPTITKNIDLYHLAREVKGAKASLSVISAEHYIATATATQDFPQMTQVIWNATMELQDLEMGFNLYQMDLSLVANMIFAVIFAVVLASHTSIFVWKQYLYFGLCFLLGTGLEFAGYVARVMAIGHYSEKGPFLCQIISLTLAPAFIMAGIYYLLAQLLVIYGRQFSRLKPLWFSYIFIFCDISSLFIQAAGGGLAAIRLQNLESTNTGTRVMLSGIAFQVLSMTLFSWLMFEFLFKIYFRASPNVKFSVGKFFALLFQTKRGRQLQEDHLFSQYNQNYNHIWGRKIFGYYPLVIIIGVLFIYVRCIYRLVELQEGWTGYLITHEQYVMTLDGLQVLLTCLLFIPFHPGFMMGKGNSISMSSIKHEKDRDTESAMYDGQYRPDDSYSMSHDEKTSIQDSDTWTYSERSSAQMPVNPYHVPKISVLSPSAPTEVVSHDSRTVPSIMSDIVHDSEPVSEKREKHKWFSFAQPSKNQDEIVAIPYDQTTEGPALSEPPAQKTQEKKTKKRNSRPRHDVDSVASINPYTRSLRNEEPRSSGPYESYGQNQRYQNYESQDHVIPQHHENTGHHEEVMSQFSNDEFLFSFGSQK